MFLFERFTSPFPGSFSYGFARFRKFFTSFPTSLQLAQTSSRCLSTGLARAFKIWFLYIGPFRALCLSLKRARLSVTLCSFFSTSSVPLDCTESLSGGALRFRNSLSERYNLLSQFSSAPLLAAKCFFAHSPVPCEQFASVSEVPRSARFSRKSLISSQILEELSNGLPLRFLRYVFLLKRFARQLQNSSPCPTFCSFFSNSTLEWFTIPQSRDALSSRLLL